MVVIFNFMKIIHSLAIITLMLFISSEAFSWEQGIYLGESRFYSTKRLNKLIALADLKHIDTFVIDFTKQKKSTSNILNELHQHGIRAVARIVVFPGGASRKQVVSKRYMQAKYNQIVAASLLDFDAIQLDYIRYSVRNNYSPQNVHDIAAIVHHAYTLVHPMRKKLQIDIFGEAAERPSRTIGQDVALLAPSVNTICPMVYPSHYHPHEYHTARPYQTVYRSISALKKQLKDYPDVRIIAYLELSNFRKRMSTKAKINYIHEQIKGAHDAGADGWYAWSAGNKYNILYRAM